MWNKHSQIAAVLLSSASCGEAVEVGVKETLVTDLIVIAHHELVCECQFDLEVFGYLSFFFTDWISRTPEADLD